MFVVRVRLTVNPESRAALLAYMQAEATKNASIDGCEAYTLYQDAADAKDSDAFGQIMTALSPLMVGKPDSAYYDSVLVGP